MKKKIMAVLGAAVLVAGTMWATLAYFTDNADVSNTFTVGKVKITLDETDITDSSATSRVDENEYKMIPGREYTKDPVLTVLAGSEACYVYIIETKGDDTDDYIDYTSGLVSALGWSSFTSVIGGETVYWKAVPASNTDTVINDIIDGDTIVIKPTLNNSDMEQTNLDVSMKYEGFAVQSEGFVDAEDAWYVAINR